MKKLKKILSLILFMCVCSLLFLQVTTFAKEEYLWLGIYNLRGERVYDTNVTLQELQINDEGEYKLKGTEVDEYIEYIDVPERILSFAEEYENFVYMDMRTDNEENPYPEIEPTTATVSLGQSSGMYRKYIGKDYHLYYAPDYDSEYMDVSDSITGSSMEELYFNIDKLGIYVLTFNPKVYYVTFYLEEPIYEDGEWTNQDCIYKQIDDLEYEDTIVFPEKPQKDGYIFTGWKAYRLVGGSYLDPIVYATPQPKYVSHYTKYYATWCPEDEYEPINIEIFSTEPITKGKEDGTKITLKTNYGIFVDGDKFPAEWREKYDSYTDEEKKSSLLASWKSKWNVVGSDEIMIETATRIDDKTVELVLSGNSSDKYTSSDIMIEFDSSLLSYETDNPKIKMDEDGIKQKMYCSDNSLTLLKQNRPSSGDSYDHDATLLTGSASSHYLLVLSNGDVAAWGDNTYGQCGLEPCEEVAEINYIEFKSKIVKAVAGNGFSIALDENGTAWGWGTNKILQIGISRPTGGGGLAQTSSPVKIADNIVDIAAGEEFSILLTRDGEVLYSGANKFDPLYVLSSDAKFIAASYMSVVAIDEDNIVDYLYDAPFSGDTEFLDVDEVQSVVCGKNHVIIRCLNGENIEYYGFGTNNYKHQLGNSQLETEPVLLLSIPYEENLKFTEFAGEYNTVVNVWDTLSPVDGVTEYRWGTDCRYLEDNQTANKATITEPEKHTVGYQTIAIGSEQNMAFDFESKNIILFGNDTTPEVIPLIGADEEFSVSDVVSMRRHLTHSYGKYLVAKDIDFNNDGKVDVKDVVLLRRYIAGGYGVELQ